MPKGRVYAILAIGVLAVSAAAIFIRLAYGALGEAGLGASMLIAAGRLLLASAMLLPFAARSLKKPQRRAVYLLAAGAGVFLALHFGFWIASLAYTSIAASVTIVTTNPIWVAGIEWLFFGRRPHRKTLFGIALAVAGGILIGLTDAGSGAGGNRPLLGDLLALFGAWAVSLYLILGREAQRALGTTGYVAVAYPSAALVLLPLPWLFGTGYLGHAQDFYLWIFLMALVPQLIGHTSLNYAVRFLGPTLVTLFVLFEPVVSSLLGFVIFNEVPPPGVFAGAAAMLAGVGLALGGHRS